MKQQILVIHGGDTWRSREEYLHFLENLELRVDKMMYFGWKENLRADLGTNFEVILPAMPNKWDAHYDEWKLFFEKILPHLRDGVILIGHSLGAAFLAKYLSEHDVPCAIKATYLVAAPYGEPNPENELLSFSPPSDLSRLSAQGGKITIFHGKDDPVVPPSHAEDYKKALPNADFHFLADRGHFGQEHFPELIQSLLDLMSQE